MSKQDIYFNKLQAGNIKTAIAATVEGIANHETQTEHDLFDKACNAPNDYLTNYQDQGNFLKKHQQDSFVLNLFVENTFPSMLRVVKENQRKYDVIR